MIPSTSLIVQAGGGGRALLKTADSITRQRTAPEQVLLVKGEDHPNPPLVESIANRLRASVVDAGRPIGAALNDAVRRTNACYVGFVPAGFTLQPAFLERSSAALAESDRIAAFAASVLLHTADAVRAGEWRPPGIDIIAALTDPRGVPPVFVVRRRVWDALGGFDVDLDGLVEYDFWLRLLLARSAIESPADPLVARDLEDRGSLPDDVGYLDALRAILAKHRTAAIDAMPEVLVARELRFGRMRGVHRDLIARRDSDLAELDRLRAEAAHDRAYLAHHGRADFEWGDLRRVDPISRDWGYDRGVPVDRRYIDDFLQAHSSDIHGAVLEVQENDFTRRFGGPRVTESAILDIDAANARATILADLRSAPQIAAASFDCIILTQTLHVIDDVAAALGECRRILKPGGVLLATFPAASRVCLEYGADGDLWRMTPAGARALFRSAFTPSQTSSEAFGNVLTNTAFLHGLATTELTDAEFEAHDPYFPAVTGIRASKSDAFPRTSARGVVLLYHRIDETADVHELGVAPPLFDAHLRWLRSECSVMPLEELLRTAAERLPDRPVAITFDDGYVDNLDVAAPLLQQYALPATFFTTSRWLDEPGEYWWDTLERILLAESSLPAWLDIDVSHGHRRWPTATADERRAAHARLHDALVHATLDVRDRIVSGLTDWSGSAAARVRPMSAEQIRELAALPGMTIGAHTVNHLAWPDQPLETRQRELTSCRTALSQVVGRPVDLFAYPYGALDRDCAALVRQSTRWGLTCDERPLADSFDAARVPRLDVKRWGVTDLASRIERLFRLSADRPPRLFTFLP